MISFVSPLRIDAHCGRDDGRLSIPFAVLFSDRVTSAEPYWITLASAEVLR